MQEIDPLTIPLRDIHLPEVISWWPLAIGWWILITLPIILLLCYLLYRYIRRDRTVADLNNRINTIEKNFHSHKDDHLLARELSVFTRQLALLNDTRDISFAATTGPQWVDYWDEEFRTASLSAEELKQALTVAPYRQHESIDGQKLIDAVRAAIATSQRTEKRPLLKSLASGAPPK